MGKRVRLAAPGPDRIELGGNQRWPTAKRSLYKRFGGFAASGTVSVTSTIGRHESDNG